MSVLCPDGKTLRLAGPVKDLMGPWAFKLRLQSPTGLTFLCAGSTGSFESVARHTERLGRYTVREVSHRGRRLVSYEDPENAITTFLWHGPHHELSWTVGGQEVSFDVFLAVLATVEMEDSAAGLLVRPKPGTGGALSMTVTANTIVDLCVITVMPIQDPSVTVPSHPGKKVRGGVMWRTDEVGPDGTVRRTAVIASASALTYLGFFDPDAPANVETSESLQVSLA